MSPRYTRQNLACAALRLRCCLDKSISFLENCKSSNIYGNQQLREIASHIVDIEVFIDPSSMVETTTDTHKSEIESLVSLLSDTFTSIEALAQNRCLDIIFSQFTELLEQSKIEKIKKCHMYKLLILVRKMNDLEKARMPKKQINDIIRVVSMLRSLRLSENIEREGSFYVTLEHEVVEVEEVLDKLKYNQMIGYKLNDQYSVELLNKLVFLVDGLRNLMELKRYSFNVSFMCWSYPQIEMFCRTLDTTPIPTAEAFGRKKHILKKLLDKNSDGMYVLPFPSYGNIKRNLVEIFNGMEVKDKFAIRLWVHVSDRSNMVNRKNSLTDSIFKIINHYGFDDNLPTQSNKYTRKHLKSSKIKEAQGIIEWHVREKNFLLIMEDVLEDQMPQLEDLFVSLDKGGKESKIVITSRNRDVLSSVGTLNTQNNLLDVSWMIFKTFTFENGKHKFAFNKQVSNEEELKSIGRRIASQLRHFPLAMKMIGKTLRANPDARYWERIEHQVCKNIQYALMGEKDTLLELLAMCYFQLPAPLCCCFIYCSLFPKDWIFEQEKMVQLWISQGFVSTHNEKESIQDVGRRYFNELISRSFFESVIDDSHTSYYTMHPVVHSLAEKLCGEEFLRIDGSDSDNGHGKEYSRHLRYWNSRHLSITANRLPIPEEVDLCELKTLIILGPTKSVDSDMLEDAIRWLARITTLYLAGCVISEFPETYTDLENLKYLNLSDTGICRLPRNFNKLYLLEVINLQGCCLEYLPIDTKNLINLQHIIGPSTLISTISGIGKLTNLQELEEFQVGNEQGHEISQLSGLSMLEGSLSITNIENVSETNEATSGWLRDLSRLKRFVYYHICCN